MPVARGQELARLIGLVADWSELFAAVRIATHSTGAPFVDGEVLAAGKSALSSDRSVENSSSDSIISSIDRSSDDRSSRIESRSSGVSDSSLSSFKESSGSREKDIPLAWRACLAVQLMRAAQTDSTVQDLQVCLCVCVPVV